MAMEDELQLGVESVLTLEYLAEGAANIVYRIVVPPPSPSTEADLNFEAGANSSDSPSPSEIPALRLDPRLEGKLVRLRKNLPSTVPVLESHKHFKRLVIPLLDNQSTKGCLVEQILFRPSKELLNDCNAKLRKMEADGSRGPKRHGVYLAEDEGYGTLVTDMSCGNDDHYVSVEFKPKWLAQSPSAPPGSRRCRTCALRAMNSIVQEDLKPSFCPVSLVSFDVFKIAPAVGAIINSSSKSGDFSEPARSALIEFLSNSSLLEALKKVQIEKDSLGVLLTDPYDPDFLTAMTLRDCTLFLKVPRSGNGKIEARFGDLDLKSPKGGKAEYWRGLERRLIHEGWYTQTEEQPNSNDNVCELARHSASSET